MMNRLRELFHHPVLVPFRSAAASRPTEPTADTAPTKPTVPAVKPTARQEQPPDPTGAAQSDRVQMELLKLGSAARAAGLSTPEAITEAAAAVSYRAKYQAYLKDDAARLAVITGEDTMRHLLPTMDIPQLEAYLHAAGRRADQLFGNSITEQAARLTQGQDPAASVPEAPGASIPPTAPKMETAEDVYARRRIQYGNGRKTEGATE